MFTIAFYFNRVWNPVSLLGPRLCLVPLMPMAPHVEPAAGSSGISISCMAPSWPLEDSTPELQLGPHLCCFPILLSFSLRKHVSTQGGPVKDHRMASSNPVWRTNRVTGVSHRTPGEGLITGARATLS